MAVQAQYPTPSPFMVLNNNDVVEEVRHLYLQQQQQKGAYEKVSNGNIMFGSVYQNNLAQQILNGTVFSEPESELTCNVSGSRKRNRDEVHLLPEQYRQNQMVYHHQQQQQHQQQHFLLSKLQKLGQTPSSSNSTVLQQSSMDENRLLASTGASTSGRSSIFFSSQNLNSNLLHQNLEIDALIRLQNEKLRAELEETRKRHCTTLLSVLEQQVLKRLQEKEAELANANSKNAELQEKLKQIGAENQIWFNVAKNNEAIASSLKSSLEQILLQNQNQGEQVKEGFGENDYGNAAAASALADDAQSCCNEGIGDEKTERENRELKEKKSCKVCRENEVSVLLLPCRHLCLCKNCDSKIEACPICKTLKNASLQIFLS